MTEWEPGEKSVFADNNYIIETTVNAYPAEICNGTTHYDTIGEQLTTLEYTCSATNKILSQTIGGKLQRRFNLQ